MLTVLLKRNKIKISRLSDVLLNPIFLYYTVPWSFNFMSAPWPTILLPVGGAPFPQTYSWHFAVYMLGTGWVEHFVFLSVMPHSEVLAVAGCVHISSFSGRKSYLESFLIVFLVWTMKMCLRQGCLKCQSLREQTVYRGSSSPLNMANMRHD